jgi:hypothetical protein
MTKDEALKLALEGLEAWSWDNDPRGADKYITAINEALAQPEHIGFMDSKLNPIQRTWVGLTDAEIDGMVEVTDLSGAYYYDDLLALARATEAKLKEKNT